MQSKAVVLLKCEKNVSSNHTLERRHERETNAKKMSRNELKMTANGKFVKGAQV
jgi:hypothetical protein